MGNSIMYQSIASDNSVRAASKHNITTESGFEILWDPERNGYILPGFGKKRFAKDVAQDFAKKLESKYGKDNTAQA